MSEWMPAPNAPILPKAVRQGILRIAEFDIRCYVLDRPNNDRILSRQDLVKALGMNANPSSKLANKSFGTIPIFLADNRIKPLIRKKLIDSATAINFKNLKWHRTIGYKAEIIRDTCYVFIDAAKAGVLTSGQLQHIAELCELLVRGFASRGAVGANFRI